MKPLFKVIVMARMGEGEATPTMAELFVQMAEGNKVEGDDKKPDPPKKDDDDDEGEYNLPDILKEDLPPNTGSATSAKFKASKEEIKRLAKEQKEKNAEIKRLAKEFEDFKKTTPTQLTDEDIQKHPVFQSLKKQFDEINGVVETVRLEKHPKFIAAHDAPIAAGRDKITKLARAGCTEDPSGGVELFTTLLDTIPAGEDNTPRFNRSLRDAIKLAMEQGGLDADTADDIRHLVRSVREKQDARHEAINKSRDIAKDYDIQDTQERRQLVEAVEPAVDSIHHAFVHRTKENAEFLKQHGEKLGYNKAVIDRLPILKAEIKKCNQSGVITSTILELAYLGIEHAYVANLSQVQLKTIRDLVEERDRMKKRLVALGDIKDDPPPNRNKGAAEEKGKPKGLIENFKAAVAAGA